MTDLRQEFIRIFIERKSEFRFRPEIRYDEQGVFEEWTEHYTPPPSVPEDALIVDVGAREGDTAIFYAVLLGYTNLRLVEPWDQHFENLNHNTDILRKSGARIEVFAEPFRPEHIKDAAFVKFDCEGCELEVDLKTLLCPAVAETHWPLNPLGSGGVLNYTPATGYLRWSPR